MSKIQSYDWIFLITNIYFIGDTLKKLCIFIILILILTISIVDANVYRNDMSLIGKVIYLDAGHGGPDPGTVYKNIYEKDINSANKILPKVFIRVKKIQSL